MKTIRLLAKGPLLAALCSGLCLVATVATAQQFDSCTGNTVTPTWRNISVGMDDTNAAGWWTPLAVSGADRYFAFDASANTAGTHKILVAKLDSSDQKTLSSCLPNSSGTCFYPDDDYGHNQPSIAVDGSGYIHVFGSMHHDGPHYWRSNQPNSVTGGFTYRGSELPLTYNTKGWTYPILATLNGDVYLLVRETATNYNNKAAILYRFSNSARTWARIYRPAFDSRNTYTVYPDSMEAADGALHIAYSWVDASAGGLRHLGSYLKYVPNTNSNTGTFYTAAGTAVSVPRKVDNGDVFRPLGTSELLTDNEDNANKPKAYQSARVAVDPQTGRPHVLYRYRDKENGSANFKVFRARWTGSTWSTNEIYTGNTQAALGITHDGSVVRAYYVKSGGGVFLKETGGVCSGWSAERALTPGDSTPRRIAVVQGPGTEDSIYSSNPGVNTLRYGRVPRDQNEADNSALHSDTSGNVWLAAVKDNGELFTRRYNQSTASWESFTSHGTGWSELAAPTVAAQADGAVWLIAVKADGTMWSRKWTSGSGWSSFTQQGTGGWSINAGPVAVRQSSGDIAFAAVEADGDLYHRTYNPSTGAWSAFVQHSIDWSAQAAPCLIAGSDGRLWLFAVKEDGRIYHRSWTSSGGWGSFVEHGAGLWSVTAGPMGVARSNGAISIAVVKNDGSVLTRHYDSSWSAFETHGGVASWTPHASPAIAYGTDGKLWLFAVKKAGTSYHRYRDPVSGWTGFVSDGSGWSAAVGRAATARLNGNVMWTGTESDSELFTRSWTGSWGSLFSHGTGWSN